MPRKHTSSGLSLKRPRFEELAQTIDRTPIFYTQVHLVSQGRLIGMWYMRLDWMTRSDRCLVQGMEIALPYLLQQL